MPTRPAASAHWYFRCSVGVTTVIPAIVRSASSSAAIRRPKVVLPAPGVAAARKSFGEAARYRASARRCQPRRPGPAGAAGAASGAVRTADDREREPSSDTRLLSAATPRLGDDDRVRTQRRCRVRDTRIRPPRATRPPPRCSGPAVERGGRVTPRGREGGWSLVPGTATGSGTQAGESSPGTPGFRRGAAHLHRNEDARELSGGRRGRHAGRAGLRLARAPPGRTHPLEVVG